mgnify:CR=1 FL=1
MACITKRRGRYVLDFYDQTGKRRWKTLSESTTKKEARVELRNIEDQVSKKAYLPSRTMPTFKTAAEDWLEYKKPFLRISTWEVSKEYTEIHFKDLDTVKVDRITTAMLEKWIRTKQEAKLKIGTIRRILVTLNQIFTYCVRHKYIQYNPLRDAERPRNQGHDEKKSIRILSPAEIKTLLDCTESQKYRIMFMLAVFGGAREGELLGLKWSDVLSEDKQIHIQRTFNHKRFFATKTKESNRKIDIGPIVLQELKKWKLASGPNKQDLVFPGEDGEPILYRHMVRQYFEPALKKAGIERIRFHDLRHTFASLLIAQGENIKYIQAQLGHSSPVVTLNVYAHLMKPTNQEAAERLESTVFGTTGCKMVANEEKRDLVKSANS